MVDKLFVTLKKIVGDFWVLLKFILPQNKLEWGVLAFFITFYLCYTCIIVFKSNLVDYPNPYDVFKHDIYFGYDAALYYHGATTKGIVHPLIGVFYYPISQLGTLLYFSFGMKAKTLLYCFVCNLTIALSTIYIYRYLKEVIAISMRGVLLLTLFFGFFSTNLILAFTPETYTSSAFFLSMFVCYFSIELKKNKDIPFVASLLSVIILGGITITNFVKGFIPIVFAKIKFKIAAIRVAGISLCMGLCLLVVGLKNKIFPIITSYYGTNSGSIEDVPLTKSIVDYFLGVPIFFSDILLLPADPLNGREIAQINIDYYHHWWQYAFVFLFFSFIIAGFIKCRKEKLVQMLALLFGVDLFIHLVMKFGLIEGYIYGGHWIYIMPLVMGWLYMKLNENKRLQTIYLASISVLFVALFINNMNQLYRFITFAIEAHPILAN